MPAENVGAWAVRFRKGTDPHNETIIGEKDPYTVLVDTPELSAKQILDAAKRGDRLALDAVEVLGKALGSALAAVAEVIDPEVFVIGGESPGQERSSCVSYRSITDPMYCRQVRTFRLNWHVWEMMPACTAA